MAEFNFTIPDAIVPAIRDALCWKYDYQNNKHTGETQVQFARRMLINILKTNIKKIHQQYQISLQSDIDVKDII